MMIHKDCFAYIDNSDKGCGALKALYCKVENCKFYKPKRDGKYPMTLGVEKNDPRY